MATEETKTQEDLDKELEEIWENMKEPEDTEPEEKIEEKVEEKAEEKTEEPEEKVEEKTEEKTEEKPAEKPRGPLTAEEYYENLSKKDKELYEIKAQLKQYQSGKYLHEDEAINRLATGLRRDPKSALKAVGVNVRDLALDLLGEDDEPSASQAKQEKQPDPEIQELKRQVETLSEQSYRAQMAQATTGLHGFVEDNKDKWGFVKANLSQPVTIEIEGKLHTFDSPEQAIFDSAAMFKKQTRRDPTLEEYETWLDYLENAIEQTETSRYNKYQSLGKFKSVKSVEADKPKEETPKKKTTISGNDKKIDGKELGKLSDKEREALLDQELEKIWKASRQ
jgi:hypothetical protein